MSNGLYRGKHFYDGDWCEGYYIKTKCSKEYRHLSPTTSAIVQYADSSPCGICIQTGNDVKNAEKPSPNSNWDVIDETVGQYSGKCDDYGVKMFEHDIVSGLFLHGLPIAGVVTFQDGAFGLKYKRGGTETFTAFACMCNVQYKVIGNIFDNPELLVCSLEL